MHNINITIYADKISANIEDGGFVNLEGVDLSDLMSQLDPEDLLAEIDLNTIMEHVASAQKDKNSDDYDATTRHEV